MTRFLTVKESGNDAAPSITPFYILPDRRPIFDKATRTYRNYYYIAFP